MLCGGEWVHDTRSYLKESSLFVWLVGSVSAMRTADLLLIRVVRFQCDKPGTYQIEPSGEGVSGRANAFIPSELF